MRNLPLVTALPAFLKTQRENKVLSCQLYVAAPQQVPIWNIPECSNGQFFYSFPTCSQCVCFFFLILHNSLQTRFGRMLANRSIGIAWRPSPSSVICLLARMVRDNSDNARGLIMDLASMVPFNGVSFTRIVLHGRQEVWSNLPNVSGTS